MVQNIVHLDSLRCVNPDCDSDEFDLIQHYRLSRSAAMKMINGQTKLFMEERSDASESPEPSGPLGIKCLKCGASFSIDQSLDDCKEVQDYTSGDRDQFEGLDITRIAYQLRTPIPQSDDLIQELTVGMDGSPDWSYSSTSVISRKGVGDYQTIASVKRTGERQEKITWQLPIGRYFLGDPCVVLNAAPSTEDKPTSDLWRRFCALSTDQVDILDNFAMRVSEDDEGEYAYFAVAPTEGGDGLYRDSAYGHPMPVDSGLIGVVDQRLWPEGLVIVADQSGKAFKRVNNARSVDPVGIMVTATLIPLIVTFNRETFEFTVLDDEGLITIYLGDDRIDNEE